MGELVTVPVSFYNFGPLDASDVQYILMLPVGINNISCSAPATCSAQDAAGNIIVTFSGGTTLAANTGYDFTLSYSAQEETGLVMVGSRISTSTDEGGSISNNNSYGQTVVLPAGEVRPDVTVTVAPPATATAGSEVAVPIVFENKGPGQASNISYTATFPPGTAFTSCSPQLCTVDETTGVVTWTSSAPLSSGEKFNAEVTYTAPLEGSVEMTANISTTPPDRNLDNNSATAMTQIEQPDMEVEITVPGVPVVVGDTATGQVICTNSGTGTALNASCNLVVPSEVTDLQLSCTPPSPVAELVSGASITCDYSFTYPDGANEPLKLVANTDADNELDALKGNNEAEADVLSGVADVYVTITQPLSAGEGQPVTSQLLFGNQGALPAEGVTYTVSGFPAGTTGVSCDGASCTYDPVTQTVTLTGLPDTLSAGQQQPVLLHWETPAGSAGTTLELTAQITTTTASNPVGNDTAQAATNVVATAGQDVDVAVQVLMPATSIPGAQNQATVRYTNLGGHDASDMYYALAFDHPDLDFVLSYQGQTCTFTEGSGAVTGCGLPSTLPVGGYVDVVVSYQVPAQLDVLTLTGSVNAANDGQTSNNTDSASTRISDGAGLPDVTATVSVPEMTAAGDTVEAQITYSNVGQTDASGMSYTISLPAGLTGVSCTPACTYDVQSGQVTVNPTDLASALQPGEQVSLTLRYTAPENGTVTVSTRVDAANEESADTHNNTATAATRVQVPGVLALLKSVYEGHDAGLQCATNTAKNLTVVDKLASPQNITWCFAVTNTGTEFLAEPAWDDPQLPNKIPQLVSGSLPLAPGATAVWYVEAVHQASVVNTVSLEMAVTDATGTLLPGVPKATGSDSVETIFALIYDPPYGVKVGKGTSQDVIRWTMVWVNDNPIRADGVQISDPITAPMTFLDDGTLVCMGEDENDFSNSNRTYVTPGSCRYDAATNSVVVEANFGADLGGNVATGQHRLFIAFNVAVPASQQNTTYENQGSASWTPPGGTEPLGPEVTAYIPGLTIDPLLPGGSTVPGVHPPSGTAPEDLTRPPPGSALPTPVEHAGSGSTAIPVPVNHPLALLLVVLAVAGWGVYQHRRMR